MKAAHAVLNEIILSGESPSERLRYRLSRKRFESESMPSKRKAQHEFDEAFIFNNDATHSAALERFGFSNCSHDSVQQIGNPSARN